MEDNRLSKVEILIVQKRYAESEKLLMDLLAEDPSNIHYMSLLAEVCIRQDRFDDAAQIVNNAIGLAPDSSHLFFIKSRIAVHKDAYDEAEKNISQAIALSPFDADYFAFFANIKLSRKDYSEALNLADKALELNAENVLALNTRSSSLIKLDRKEDAYQTIEGALREDPNNAYTHANYGWGLLEKGDYKKALEHFKQSLKSDPSFSYAQSGMMEALKATNPLYRFFLKYAFWIGNLTAKYQWGVIIGFYIGFRALRVLADKNEGLQPVLMPLLFLLALMAFSTWVIEPISNLFLRFNAYGKVLLDKNEKRNSNMVAISLSIFAIGTMLYFLLTDDKYLAIAAFGFAMMVISGRMFSPSKYNNALFLYPIVMAVIGLWSITVTFTTGELFNGISSLFLVGFIGYQWVANFLVIKENNQ